MEIFIFGWYCEWMCLFFSKWIEVEIVTFKVATIVNVKINNYILIRFKNYIEIHCLRLSVWLYAVKHAVSTVVYTSCECTKILAIRQFEVRSGSCTRRNGAVLAELYIFMIYSRRAKMEADISPQIFFFFFFTIIT